MQVLMVWYGTPVNHNRRIVPSTNEALMPLRDVRRMYHIGERATPSRCKLYLEGGEIVPCVAQAAGVRIGQLLLDVETGHLPQAVLASVIDGEVVTGTIHVCSTQGGLSFLEVGQDITFTFRADGQCLTVPAGKLIDFTI